MPEVVLNVSPFVKRVFTARYGDEPIKIHRSDIVYHYLKGDPLVANRHRYRSLQKLLTEQLTLNVSNLLARRLRSRKRQVYVGYYLHKVYQDEILVFVDAQVKAGIPAQTSMKQWLNENGVQEDDYGLDTAYTSWKRKKNFLSKIKSRNKGKSNTFQCATDPVEIIKYEQLNQVPEDYRDVIIAANDHFQVGFVNLLCCSIRIESEAKTFTYIYTDDRSAEMVYPRKVLCYVLNKYCWLSGYDIAKFVKVSPSRIYAYIREIEFSAQHYPEIKSDIEALLTHNTKPIPC